MPQAKNHEEYISRVQPSNWPTWTKTTSLINYIVSVSAPVPIFWTKQDKEQAINSTKLPWRTGTSSTPVNPFPARNTTSRNNEPHRNYEERGPRGGGVYAGGAASA